MNGTESKMYYRDEDRSMKGLQELPLFTADEGTLVNKKRKDIFVLLNIWNNLKLKTEIDIRQENFRRIWYVGASFVKLCRT
jgi:hypothetical protein